MPDDMHESFRAVYTEHYSAVLGYCLRRADPDSARDLVSEVFVVAWRKRAGLPDPEFVLPWLYAVAAKTIANHRRGLRRRLRLIERAGRLTHRNEPSAEVQVIRRSDDAAVIEAVAHLRSGDRDVILLSAWEGLSAPEIAVSLEISVDAAEKRLARAKRRLRDELERMDRAAARSLARKGGT